MNLKICYYDLVGVNSKTLILYRLINFTLFSWIYFVIYGYI
jgi:hypothetical protein